MPDRENVISEIVEHIEATLAVDSEYVTIPLDLLQYAIALLKKQEEQIKKREESLEKARAEIKWLRGMLKEQEGTIEETRGEWSDETLPVSRNKEREYPSDHSRWNKA